MSRKKPQDPRKSLLGDLESIRSLLNRQGSKEAAVESATSQVQDDPEVPLLEDVVVAKSASSGAVRSDEQITGEISEESVLGDDLFQALLGGEWTTSVAEILEQARESIEQHDARWTPSLTEELNEALKDRINHTVHGWLQEVIVRHADELRCTLIEALSDELATSIKRFSHKQSNNQNPEGADGE